MLCVQGKSFNRTAWIQAKLHRISAKRQSSNEEKSTDSGRKIACASATIQEDVISMCVVPVKEKHKDSNFVYSTFAMLDNCSQGCFAKASLMKALQIRDQKTSITLKSLTGEDNHICFRRSESLQSVGFKPSVDKLTKDI